jgi:hypothetical protein
MVAGDIVSAITAGSIGVVSYFQPAANVEIVVLFVPSNGLGRYGIYDGTNNAIGYSGYNAANGSGTNGSPIKVGITNSVYLYVFSDSSNAGYSGIQIK